jgi:hypothetical protein
MSTTTQAALTAELRGRLDAANQRARAVVEGLDAATLVRRPANGGWSIGEVLEHLIVSADSYLQILPDVIARARSRHVGGPSTEWRPSAIGGWLERSLRPGTRAMPAPKSYRPGPAPRPGVLAEFLDRQASFARLMDDAGALDWRRVRLGSPILRLIRMNLGDAFRINATHVERHLGQAERVRAGVTSGAATASVP